MRSSSLWLMWFSWVMCTFSDNPLLQGNPGACTPYGPPLRLVFHTKIFLLEFNTVWRGSRFVPYVLTLWLAVLPTRLRCYFKLNKSRPHLLHDCSFLHRIHCAHNWIWRILSLCSAHHPTRWFHCLLQSAHSSERSLLRSSRAVCTPRWPRSSRDGSSHRTRFPRRRWRKLQAGRSGRGWGAQL